MYAASHNKSNIKTFIQHIKKCNAPRGQNVFHSPISMTEVANPIRLIFWKAIGFQIPLPPFLLQNDSVFESHSNNKIFCQIHSKIGMV